MAKCFNIKDCEEMIKKIKSAQRKYPNEGYDYWCPNCDSFNKREFCYCDNEE